MKKRPTTTVASPGQGGSWIILWLSHLLIPWILPVPTLRKPPSGHRKKRSEGERPALTEFTNLVTLGKNRYYLNSG